MEGRSEFRMLFVVWWVGPISVLVAWARLRKFLYAWIPLFYWLIVSINSVESLYNRQRILLPVRGRKIWFKSRNLSIYLCQGLSIFYTRSLSWLVHGPAIEREDWLMSVSPLLLIATAVSFIVRFIRRSSYFQITISIGTYLYRKGWAQREDNIIVIEPDSLFF